MCVCSSCRPVSLFVHTLYFERSIVEFWVERISKPFKRLTLPSPLPFRSLKSRYSSKPLCPVSMLWADRFHVLHQDRRHEAPQGPVLFIFPCKHLEVTPGRASEACDIQRKKDIVHIHTDEMLMFHTVPKCHSVLWFNKTTLMIHLEMIHPLLLNFLHHIGENINLIHTSPCN